MFEKDHLRVLHFGTGALPYSVGGSEVFMHNLARELSGEGVTVHCAFHRSAGDKHSDASYEHEGVSYSALPNPITTRTRTEIAQRRSRDLPGFEDLISHFKPDILHLHDSSSLAGNSHLELARKRGIHTVMTYHSPGQSCQQRELLFAGRVVCDGELRVGRCSECRLQAGGAPTFVAKFTSRFNLPVINPDSKSSISRLLSMRKVTKHFILGWHEMIDQLDMIHCHAGWVEKMLHTNHVPGSKLRMYRTGLPMPNSNVETTPDPSGKLRVAFLGRFVRIKGLESFIAAVKLLPEDAPIEIALYGQFSDAQFEPILRNAIRGDSRFAQPTGVKPSELNNVWKKSDVLAVPSIWLETGPLVVLEAFAAGVPVIGSRLGGIEELVRDGIDGLLHKPGDPTSIAALLNRLLKEKDLLPRLRAGIRPPRTMGDLARDLIPEYRRLIQR